MQSFAQGHVRTIYLDICQMAQSSRLQRREASLTLELYAVSKRLSEQVMRFDMVYEYLIALFEMRLTYLADSTEYIPEIHAR
jgi:hypothetical protein